MRNFGDKSLISVTLAKHQTRDNELQKIEITFERCQRATNFLSWTKTCMPFSYTFLVGMCILHILTAIIECYTSLHHYAILFIAHFEHRHQVEHYILVCSIYIKNSMVAMSFHEFSWIVSGFWYLIAFGCYHGRFHFPFRWVQILWIFGWGGWFLFYVTYLWTIQGFSPISFLG